MVVREAGRIRMGFYPLPLSETQRIRRWITFPEVVSAALDPCAGDGMAFEAITEGAMALRYGIELDAYRAEHAGFTEIRLELHIGIEPDHSDIDWETRLRVAPNPKIPTLEEAMHDALTPAEIESFVAHLKPLFDARKGINRRAVAYLWATKT